jgi:APA family basic amino acid/polyamine antiporter
MARDGLFFQSVGWLSARSGVPVVAIVLQGITATVIAIAGGYEHILSYVVSIDFIFFGLTAASLFIFRREPEPSSGLYLTPGHPYTTALFVLASAGIVISTIASAPANTAIGLGILLAGIPVYLYWSQRTRRVPPQPKP